MVFRQQFYAANGLAALMHLGGRFAHFAFARNIARILA